MTSTIAFSRAIEDVWVLIIVFFILIVSPSCMGIVRSVAIPGFVTIAQSSQTVNQTDSCVKKSVTFISRLCDLNLGRVGIRVEVVSEQAAHATAYGPG